MTGETAAAARGAVSLGGLPIMGCYVGYAHHGWTTSAADLWFIPEFLVGVPHRPLLPPSLLRNLTRVDRRSLQAGLVGYREH